MELRWRVLVLVREVMARGLSLLCHKYSSSWSIADDEEAVGIFVILMVFVLVAADKQVMVKI